MALLGRILTIIIALLGGGVFSQAPEFTQQYRQRIGGALDELRTIVVTFETQAAQNGLDRQSALNVYAASPQPFLRNQGDAIRQTLERYDMLAQQQQELAREPAVTRPLLMLRRADRLLAESTLKDFVPAVPVDLAGLAWAAAGLLCGWVAAAGCGAMGRGATRRLRHRSA